VLITMVGGTGDNAIGFLRPAQDWATYGQIQQSISYRPGLRGSSLPQARSPLGRGENYVSRRSNL